MRRRVRAEVQARNTLTSLQPIVIPGQYWLDAVVLTRTPADELTELRRQLEKGRVVVVAGAGVSTAVTGGAAPSWGKLLKDGLAACVEHGLMSPRLAENQARSLEEGDVDAWIAVASLVERKLRADGSFGAWLVDTFKHLEAKDVGLIGALANLDCPLLTTNYDGLLEKVTHRERCTWRQPAMMARALRAEIPRIVHLHGHFEEPNSVILGFQGYERIAGDDPLQTLERAITVDRSLLFVGAGGGAGDPNLGALLAWYREAFKNESAYRHFLLERSSEVAGSVDWLRRAGVRIAVIAYGENYEDLTPFVRGLAQHTPGRLSLLVDSYRKRDASTSDARLSRVDELVEGSQLAAALELVETTLGEVEAAVAADGKSAAHRQRRAELQSRRATILMLLDDRDAARTQLEAIDRVDLTDGARAQVARNLFALGSRDEAFGLLAEPDATHGSRALRVFHLEADPSLIEEDDDAELQAVAARALSREGRPDEAGRIALRLLSASEPVPQRIQLVAATLLQNWLVQSCTHTPDGQLELPVSDRAGGLAVLDSVVGALAQVAWEGPAGQWFTVLEEKQLGLVGLPSEGRDPEKLRERASEMVLPEWAREFEACGPEPTVEQLERLLARWPSNLAIHEGLAEKLWHAGDLERATVHARTILEILPGRRQRCRLAGLLAEAGEFGEAAEVAATLEGIVTWETLYLRGALARQKRQHEEAVAVLGQLLELAPGHLNAAVLCAHSMAELGRREEAAEGAWKAFEDDVDGVLGVSEYGVIWRLLSRSGVLDDSGRERLQSVAERLHDRFPHEPDAERLRFNILTQLGFPAAQPAVDYELLVDAGHMYRGSSVDELREFLHESQRRREGAWALYQRGVFSSETLCTAGETDVFRLIVTSADVETMRLSPPVRTAEPTVPVRDRTVLLGGLELALLTQLRILDAAAQGAGQLETFEDVRAQLDDWRVHLPLDVRPGWKAQLESLQRTLLGHRQVELRHERPATDDLTWAGDLSLPVLHHEDPGDTVEWIPGAVVPRLAALSELERAAWAKVVSAEDDGAPEEFPERFAVTWVTLFHQLHHLDLLDNLLEELPPGATLVVGPATAERLRVELRKAEHDERVADLAVATWDAVTRLERRGLLSVRPRPSVPAELLNLQNAEVDTAFLSDPWSWREAQRRHEPVPAVLLAADHATGAWFGEGAPLGVLVGMGWTHDSYLAAQARYRGLSQHQLHVPGLVRQLETVGALDAELAAAALKELSGLGFVEALDAKSLLAVLRRVHGDVSHTKLERLLGAAEHHLEGGGHPGRPFLLMRLSFLYAEAIWLAFAGGSQALPVSDAIRAMEGLLWRAEELAERELGAVELVLMGLAYSTASHPRAALLPGQGAGPDSDVLIAGEGSPSAILWDGIGRWAAGSRQRQRVAERAISDGLVRSTARGPSIALHIALSRLSTDPRAAFDRLSVGWFARMALSAHSPDEAIRRSGLRLTNEHDADAEREFDYASLMRRASAKLEGEQRLASCVEVRLAPGLLVEVPVELALIGASDLTVHALGPALARALAVRDGRAEAAVRAWSMNPTSDELRREAAVKLARSPARMLAADPSWLLAWRRIARSPDHYPASIEDLRGLLNEVAIGDGPLFPVLMDRFRQPPLPAWEPATAAVMAESALRVPLDVVQLAAVSLYALLTEDQEYLATKAIRRLRSPRQALASELATSFLVLRAHAAGHKTMELDGEVIDLRETLPSLAADLIAQALTRGPEGTLAWAEVALYRESLRIVQFLASGSVHVSLRERLWLAFRLTGWIADRFREAESEEVAHALRRLVLLDAKVPSGTLAWWPMDSGIVPADQRAGSFDLDLLHPRGWAAGGVADGQPGADLLEMRLATLLAALRWSEVPLDVTFEQPVEAPTFTSARLEQTLVELACRRTTRYERALRKAGARLSCLSVASEDGDLQPVVAVPDQALLLLLGLAGPLALPRLEPEVRTRFVTAITDTEAPLPGPLSEALIDSLRTTEIALTPAEIGALREAARREERSEAPRAMLMLDLGLILAKHSGTMPPPALIGAAAAGGAKRIGHIYRLVAQTEPAALAAAVARVAEHSADPFDALQPLGLLGLRGDGEARASAAAVVAAHGSDAAIACDPRYAALAQLFGLEPPV